MSNTFNPYASSEDVRTVVHRFEECDFGPDEFHHSDHLTVALYYLMESTEEQTCERMRDGLQRFLRHHGNPDAYHETITVFWIKLVKQLIENSDNALPLVQLANDVVARCNNSQLINDHFSKERLASEEARRMWVEPDVKPMGC